MNEELSQLARLNSFQDGCKYGLEMAVTIAETDGHHSAAIKIASVLNDMLKLKEKMGNENRNQ